MRKKIGDKDMNIKTVLKREAVVHLEAVTRIEEEEQTSKVAVIRRDESKNLVEAVTKLVNQLSVDDKQRENRWNQSKNRSSSRGRWVDDRGDRPQQQERGFSDKRRFPTPKPSHRDSFLGRDDGMVSSAEPVDKKDTFRGIVDGGSYVEFPNSSKETALSKKSTTTVRSLEFIQQLQLNVKRQKSYFMGTDALD